MPAAPLLRLLTAALTASAIVAPGALAASAPGGAAPVAGAPPASAEPAPAPRERAREPRERSVLRQLRALRDRGLITAEAYGQDRDRYLAAKRTLKKLDGRRRAELGSVLRTLRAVAHRRELTSTRTPLAFETLERNRQWWTTGALLAYGARVGFPGSELVWQSYPGQGIQVQWLATFGKANGLFAGKTFDDRLRRLLDEAVLYGADRAGGVAFESWFEFDGGRPPWVSSLSQGTGLQALARGGIRLRDPGLIQVAREGLGIFRRKPPTGVRVRTRAGAHYLQYSFAPKLRIVNGFVQSLNGLYDFAALANDDEARRLFATGDAQLREELPRADTGAWSRYSVGGKESDLGYHTLLRDFLRGLCGRTETPLYCQTAQRFTDDLTRPPTLTLIPAGKPARKGHTARVAFRLDKVSTVSLSATRDGELIYARTARVPRGRSAYRLPKLRKAGTVALSVRAVDPAGNAAAAAGRLRVRR